MVDGNVGAFNMCRMDGRDARNAVNARIISGSDKFGIKRSVVSIPIAPQPQLVMLLKYKYNAFRDYIFFMLERYSQLDDR